MRDRRIDRYVEMADIVKSYSEIHGQSVGEDDLLKMRMMMSSLAYYDGVIENDPDPKKYDDIECLGKIGVDSPSLGLIASFNGLISASCDSLSAITPEERVLYRKQEALYSVALLENLVSPELSSNYKIWDRLIKVNQVGILIDDIGDAESDHGMPDSLLSPQAVKSASRREIKQIICDENPATWVKFIQACWKSGVVQSTLKERLAEKSNNYNIETISPDVGHDLIETTRLHSKRAKKLGITGLAVASVTGALLAVKHQRSNMNSK